MTRHYFFVFAIFFAFQIQQPVYAAGTEFMPPGELESGSGNGVRDNAVLFPTMRFPLEVGPAYLNSQVYRRGGNKGPKGGQCASENYSLPWRDNFCESRGYPTPLCPAGTGHQGQDVRPPTCDAKLHWAVAAEDGVIAQIGVYSVTLQAKSGTLYRYLHLHMAGLAVKELDSIKRGARIGQVSKDFGGTPTTIHLHFEIKDSIVISGKPVRTFLPPYASLVHAYKKLMDGKP